MPDPQSTARYVVAKHSPGSFFYIGPFRSADEARDWMAATGRGICLAGPEETPSDEEVQAPSYNRTTMAENNAALRERIQELLTAESLYIAEIELLRAALSDAIVVFGIGIQPGETKWWETYREVAQRAMAVKEDKADG